MPAMNNSVLVSLLLCSVPFAVGCVPQPYLIWESRPPAPMLQGRVAVKYVPNKRPPKHGDTELNNLGNERSGWGIPYAIRLQGDVNPSLDQTVSRVVAEAMSAAGIGMTQLADPGRTADLSIEIVEFWCDGYGVYKASVGLQLVFLDPATGAIRTQVPLRHEGAGGWCRDAYRQALTGIYNDVMYSLAQPGLRMAAISGGLPPMPPGGQPAMAPPLSSPPAAAGGGL